MMHMPRALAVFIVSLIVGVALSPPASIGQVAPNAHVGKPTFPGIWRGVFISNKVEQTKVEMMLQQSGLTITGTYLTEAGTQGVLYGTATEAGNQASFTVDQKSPGCSAQFRLQAQATGKQMTFVYEGASCNHPEKGSGRATRISSAF
jgi:hypothetical protein